MTSGSDVEVQAVLGWLARYTSHLERAIPGLAQGEPDEAWENKRQEFDDELRRFDTELLHRLRHFDTVQDALLQLFETQGRFRKALNRGMGEVNRRRDETRKGQRALWGYSEAGERLRSGAFFVEKSY